MKKKDANDIRKLARLTTKMITDLGSPWGPDEAYVAGYKDAERTLGEIIEAQESDIYDLKKRLAKYESQ